MSKILSQFKKEQRKNNSNYFTNGKPKKSAMLCRNKEYIEEVTKINGIYNISWACGGGNRCPLYASGCDNKGND